MIGWFAGLAAKAALPSALRRVPPIVWQVAAALGVVALLWVGWSLFDGANDRQAVDRDRAAAGQAAAERQMQADRQAGAARDARDAQADREQRERKEKGDAALRDGRSPWDAVANEL